MLEARDRRVRPVEMERICPQMSNGILVDPPKSPVRRIRTRVSPSGVGRGGFGTPGSRNVLGRNLYASSFGRDNTPAGRSVRRGRGAVSPSDLPSWYPRTPLRDITSIMKAIERKRAGLRGVDSHQTGSLMVCDSSTQLYGHPEHKTCVPSTGSEFQTPSVSKPSKISLDVTDQIDDSSELLTPQKLLLNSIDVVEKIVMEEIQKLKRTPSCEKGAKRNQGTHLNVDALINQINA